MASYEWHWWFAPPVQALWPRVSDTDWINRHAGLPPVHYEYEPLPTGGTRTKARIALGPFTIRWIEPPFVWREPEFYAIERRYENGPLKLFRSRTTLRAENGGTAIDVRVELIARHPLLAWILPLVAWYGRTGAARAFAAAAASAQTSDPVPEVAVAPPLFGRKQLREAGFEDALLDKLAVFLETAEDRDLAKIRAYELADRWHEPRKRVLHLLLTAVRLGVLNLSWDVMCGNCRGTKLSAASLQDVTSNVHCDGCNVEFGPQFDRSVEVTFNAHPMGKGLNAAAYCLAGPQTGRHVVAQQTLAPHGSADLTAAVAPGRYVANAMFAGALPFATEDGGKTALEVTVSEQGLTGIPPSVAAAELTLSMTNATGRDVLVRLERSEWPDTIVTAADITAMQEFRDLFSSEVLATGLELSIQSMTVLFTDLVGSTAMYSKSGDAPAFRIVSDHFDQMRAIIAQYDGAIVKTIGDAVMAVFRDSGNCLEAALRLPQAVGTVPCEGGQLQLRVGFHSGPCIAMRANDRLDYFGTTVNLASRLEHVAKGGEVAFTATTGTFPHMQAVVKKYGLHPQTQRIEIKGFEDSIAVQRVGAFA